MELLLERAQKSGDVLVAVRFDKSQRNFSVEELKWWPRLEQWTNRKGEHRTD